MTSFSFSFSAKTRIQVLPKGKGNDDLSMISVLLRIYKKEGIMGWYSGFAATMINTFSMRTFSNPPRPFVNPI